MGLFDFLKGKDKGKTTNTNTTPSFNSLRIQKVVKQTPDAISVYFEIPSSLKNAYGYVAGQYITLKENVAGQTLLRSYSLSSSPLTDDYFRIAIKRKVGGALSGHLVDNLKAGQTLDVFSPLGTFTPRMGNGTNNYFLYAGGSGITPLIAIAKTLLHKKPDAQVVLVYANQNWEQVIYLRELEELEKKYAGRFKIHHLIDDASNSTRTSHKGIFQAADYAKLINTKHEKTYAKGEHFICGPTPMMQAVETGLKDQLKVNTSQIIIEYFDMSKQPASATKTHVQKDNNFTAASTNTSTSTTKTNGVTATVILEGETHQIAIPPQTTVLEACLDAGLDAPFMCEAGVCSTCRALLSKGAVTMANDHSLSDNEKAEGFILCCQSLPKTEELVVDFDH